MEKLQMVKYRIKKARLDFTGDLKSEEKDLELENDLQDRAFQLMEKTAELVDTLTSGEEEIEDVLNSDSDSWEDESD
jgi:hypothetical protein